MPYTIKFRSPVNKDDMEQSLRKSGLLKLERKHKDLLGNDLDTVTDPMWPECSEILGELVDAVLVPGISISGATKILHRRWPRMIPIVDMMAVLPRFDGNPNARDKAGECVRVIGEIRSDMREVDAQLIACEKKMLKWEFTDGSKYRFSSDKGIWESEVVLSRVRIADIVMWHDFKLWQLNERKVLSGSM